MGFYYENQAQVGFERKIMINLRVANISDAKALCEIYKYYVENSTISFEFAAPDVNEFSKRIIEKLEKYPFLVAEEDGCVVGYAYASSFRERAAYGWDAELSVYVDKNKRHQRIGTQLYTALIDILKLQNFVSLYAGVTTPNPASSSLHENFGFNVVGTYHAVGYKKEQWLDVIWYEKTIGDLCPPKPIILFPNLNKELVDKILSTQSI